MDSILDSVKTSLGLTPEYTPFDVEIQMHINSVFSTLWELGVGPTDGFEITGSSETWQEFLPGEKRLNNIKTYIYLRVRLLYDTPTASTAVAAIQDQIKELEWRINSTQETIKPPFLLP